MGAITGTTAAVVGALSLLGGAEAARQVSERKTAKKQQKIENRRLVCILLYHSTGYL